jgi:protein ImuA
MGPVTTSPRLQHLRQTLAALDPTLAPQLADAERAVRLAPPIDTALGGGLACGTLHELAPVAPIHLATATGFALALATRASGDRGQFLWIATDFAVSEGGGPYGPGLDLYGLASARLLMLRVPRAVDVLWAMEEALRCRALAGVIAELTEDDTAADLTATRRLVLATREGQGFGLLLRHSATALPSAAATRWRIAAASSEPDRFGGLGRPRFELSLLKNRRGPCGRWIVEWCPHERNFHTAISLGLAATAFDRPDRAPLVRAG